jgi:DNA recombination protein RmuC
VAETNTLVKLINTELANLLYINKEDITNNLSQGFQTINQVQKNQLDSLSKQLQNLEQVMEVKQDNLRNLVSEHLYRIQQDNNSKLDKMRETVEEKLHNTLEQRLGSSFKLISERLEQVHKGLGEMQVLASGVGDLKKVLTNVKARGIWGEIQLDAILKQILTPHQYEKNVAVNPKLQDRVEYAIKLPGRGDLNSVIWLPIDSKFPLEAYQKLIKAYDSGNVVAVESETKELESAIKREAKLISEKYIVPPYSTDFAIMFLPIEGLYAEILRNVGLVELLQREYRVMLTSPTTLTAILSSLQMGFKTLAIEKHSSEVWKVLTEVKVEFSKFAESLSKTKIKLEQASKEIGNVETRTRVMQKHLNDIDAVKISENDNEVIDKIELVTEKAE